MNKHEYQKDHIESNDRFCSNAGNFFFLALIFHLNFQGLWILRCNGILLLKFYMPITMTVVEQMQQYLQTKWPHTFQAAGILTTLTLLLEDRACTYTFNCVTSCEAMEMFTWLTPGYRLSLHAYYWTLHCASSMQFTIHNWCSYCCFMVFCSASHMVTSLHIPQLCSAQLPNATHPTCFTLNHTLSRSLIAVMHLF